MTANSVVNQIFQSESFVLQKGLNCPKSTIQCSWYRRPFPIQNPRFNAVGTPESLFLYQIHDSRRWYTRWPFPVPNPRFKALVHQMAFSCTKPTIQGDWYTRRPFPVQTHDSMQLVHQKAFPCTKPTIQGVGTPDGLFLYQLQSSN